MKRHQRRSAPVVPAAVARTIQDALTMYELVTVAQGASQGDVVGAARAWLESLDSDRPEDRVALAQLQTDDECAC